MAEASVSQHPFRFGVAAGTAISRTELLETARAVEDLGYDVFSCSDHLNMAGSEMAPLVMLSAVAAVTSQLQLQPLVLANDFRHPAVLANEIATLDVISDGRCALGMGAGWLGPDFQLPGIPFESAGTRIARLAESVDVVRGLHSGEPFSYNGEHYNVSNMTGTPKPIRLPVPLMIGGAGRHILSVAARMADTVSINMGLPLSAGKWQQGKTPYADVTDQKLNWIRAAAGKRFSALELQASILGAAITDADPLDTLQPLASMLGVSSGQLWGSPHVLVGSVSQCVQMLESWRERWGISYVTLPLRCAAEFAPVVAALRGR